MDIIASEKKIIMILLLPVTFLVGTTINLYTPALPEINKYFSASNHLVQLTISLHLLGFSFGQIFLGILSDNIGRRKVLIMSNAFFSIISFVCAMSPNIFFLIFCRFLQGFAIAGAGVVARAIAVDCFSGVALNKAMAFITTGWTLGPVIGPIIGGYLQYFFNWQSCFYFFGIYGLLLFGYTLVLLPETGRRHPTFTKKQIYANITTILKNPLFLLYTLLAALIYSVIIVFNTITSFLIQAHLKYSVIVFSHLILLLGVSLLVGNISNRFLLQYLKPKQLILFGIIGALIMTIAMLITGILIPPNLYILILPTIFIYFFSGFIYANAVAENISLFPQFAGTTSAIFGSSITIIVFVITTISALLNTNSQIPMSIMFLCTFSISLFIFYIAKRISIGFPHPITK